MLYQIVWERALFTLYGTNIESVTMIVTVFMLGLGLGSLAGGRLSTVPGLPLVRAFGAAEVCVGLFGSGSLALFHGVAEMTAGRSTFFTGITAFLLLCLPTLLMGCTLPLLVKHLVRSTANVGDSVGSLYAVNTLGSGCACLLASLFVLRVFGETDSVRLAAALNILVGSAALMWRNGSGETAARADLPGEEQRAEGEPEAAARADRRTLLPWIGMVLAGLTGFLSLAYEILWYRLYAYTSGGTAPCFADLLAFYLFGIAYGSFAVHDVCRKKLQGDLKGTLRLGAVCVLAGALAAYLLGPALSWAVHFVTWSLTLVMVSVAAALLGAAFPILSHATVGPRGEAGRNLSYLYLSNIIGSALGSFLIGFVVLDHWSTRATSVALLAMGLAVATALAGLAGAKAPKAALALGLACGAVLAIFSGPMFSGLYARLLFRNARDVPRTITEVVENRSGVIAVDSLETVWGGGTYDGHFSIDPVDDINGVFRAYAVPALHPKPAEFLMIGLSSGSWAQVIANDPAVRELTIVEINPGYLPLIRERAEVRSLLTNPKVHIVIDDGRRWLVAHPDRRFDFILMNTTYHWRANVSNLLSTEFLQLVREHLKPGGVEYYNTTWSRWAEYTGASAFPYTLRLANFMAVSDSPIQVDRARWREVLTAYQIDGRPVFDLSRPEDRAALDRIVSMPIVQGEPENGTMNENIELRPSLMARLRGTRPITDDNMGLEWSGEGP